jgi:hypothetical protein
MMAIEDRVRDTLHELADTVPPSRHPRADFERRLARRHATRWRTPVLATVAAALVVVAGVAVPVAMNRPDDVPEQRVATSQQAPVPPPTGITADSLIGTITVNNVEETVVLRTKNGNEWCVALASGVYPPRCEPVPIWPTGPEGNTYVVTRPVLGGDTPDSGPLPSLMLFVTAPNITTLDVRDGAGEPVDVSLAAGTDTAMFFLADFGGSSQGFGYDAKDAQGAIVESAIT